MPAPSSGRPASKAATRSFVALPCPDELRDAIADAHRRWVELDAAVRWVAPDRAHLTLRFLGGASRAQLDDLDPLLRETGARSAPITFAPSGTGAFPGWKRPRVLWVGLDDGDASQRLASEVEDHARAVGFAAEERRFHPHITLGRVKGRRGLDQVIGAIRQWNPTTPAETIDEMILYASELTPSGSCYTPLARYPLKGTAAS